MLGTAKARRCDGIASNCCGRDEQRMVLAQLGSASNRYGIDPHRSDVHRQSKA